MSVNRNSQRYLNTYTIHIKDLIMVIVFLLVVGVLCYLSTITIPTIPVVAESTNDQIKKTDNDIVKIATERKIKLFVNRPPDIQVHITANPKNLYEITIDVSHIK